MTTVISTAEDKIALMLGRSLVRTEMLQARIDSLEAQLAATEKKTPTRHPNSKKRGTP